MSASSEPAGGDTVQVVVLGRDLHARPAGLVARAAARHDAAVELVAGARRADARSVLAVMGLGASAGTSVRVIGSGPDAARAADEVAAILADADG
jgi:phosphotransferase system HPr (HPr) family protein